MDDKSNLRNRKRNLAASAALRRLSSPNKDISSSTENLSTEYEVTKGNGIVSDSVSKENISNGHKLTDAIDKNKNIQNVIEKDKLLDDLCCPICFRLFSEPLTLRCGHSYCRACITRALSSKPIQECPLCRDPLMLDASNAKVNVIIQKLLENHFETELMERKKEEKEDADELENIRPSIFLFLAPNIVAMPGQKITFNMFESRYLLLCERAIQGNRMFGIQRSINSPVGTLMKIESFQNNDSAGRRRLIINCIGIKPYKPENVTLELDTNELYRCTANCIPPPELVPGQADDIIFNCYNRINILYERTPPAERTLLCNDIGPLPEFGSDPYKLLYWLAACLPLRPEAKETVLDNTVPIENRYVILSSVLLNDLRPPTLSTSVRNLYRGGLLQSLLIFGVVFVMMVFIYLKKQSDGIPSW
jgi:Lon protease-like protein